MRTSKRVHARPKATKTPIPATSAVVTKLSAEKVVVSRALVRPDRRERPCPWVLGIIILVLEMTLNNENIRVFIS